IVEEPVYVLVNLGADVNAKDNRGDTVLHFAAFSSNSKKVAFLLKHKADKTVRNNEGQTAADLLRGQMSAYTPEGKKDILYKEMEKMLTMLQ
ncbi:MAG: ankyrin repeat domain-containing protein, partial [Leptospiraceae bacterium]|nr:ankyrin repeat domain-containing protein [Leptospiraceae bacterium]